MLACAICAGGCGGTRTHASAVLANAATVAAAAANPVTISPLPGTPDASPATQVSFLGAAGTSVADVRVVGSRSGVHGGQLRAYSTGTGESFLPTHPFVEGERVTVSARTVSAHAHARVAESTFTVAYQSPIAQKPFPLSAGDSRAVQHYSSAPELSPSTVSITTSARPGAAPGDLFLAPYQSVGMPGPMIVDQGGSLVWFHPLPAGQAATNFGVGEYHGAPVLTWWQGRVLELGFGQGEDVIYDTSYQPVASVHAGNGYRADLHTVHLTPAGTAWVDAYDPVRMNLTAVGGQASGVLSDSVVQEIDIKTGLVMWEWHALGHIALTDSKNPVPASSYPWDYVHINSIDPGPQGDLLLSFRNTWSLDDLDIHSGGFRWAIGGSHSTFKLGPGVKFYWQHDGAFRPGGLVSLFDNGSDPAEEKQSRGLLLAPDFRTHTVTLVRELTNPNRTLLASSQGNMQSLPGGNWLVGYGGLPNFTEFDGAGRVLLDGTLGPGVQSFAANLSPWSGQPIGAPAVAAQPSAAGGMTVAVSWNGATRVSAWRVLAGPVASRLSPSLTAPRAGFETTISAPAAGPYVAVQALDAAGAVIGVSATVKA